MFWSIWPPRWDTIWTKPPKEKSVDRSGSSGILIILVSVAVPEKLPGHNRCDEEEREFLGIFDIFLK